MRCRRGRGHLGLAQPLLWTTASSSSTPRRLQAARRGGGRDHGQGPGRSGRPMGLSPRPRTWAGHTASRTPRGATSCTLRTASRRHLTLEGMKIVLDCANGASYKRGPAHPGGAGGRRWCAMGVPSPTGRNINHQCGSLYPDCLAAHRVRGGGRGHRPGPGRRRRPAHRGGREGRGAGRRPASWPCAPWTSWSEGDRLAGRTRWWPRS